MRKLTLLIVTITLVIVLSACSPKPFNPPEGGVFVEKDYVAFEYFNGSDTEELYRFDFFEELYYFVGPFDNNVNFTAVNNYKLASKEFTRFLQSFDDGVYDRIEAEYGGSITLSLKATETNYNEIKIKVDEIFDIDAHFVTEEGLQMIFLYTEFEKDNEVIIVPTSLFGFTHEIYHLSYLIVDSTMVGSNEENYVNFGYESLLVPVPHKSYSKVVSVFANEDGNFQLPSLITNSDFSATCKLEDVTCNGDVYTALEVYIDESTTASMVYDFYIDNFDGITIEDDFVFYNNLVAFSFELLETDGKITLMIEVYE